MVNQRWRPLVFCLIVLVGIWAIALTGYIIAKNSKMTAERVRAYAESVDLSKLSAAARTKAIQKLEDMLNRLLGEERRRARLEGVARRWFEEMTEEEKGEFIEATMPTGFKQMLTAFEELPDDKRRRVVDDALRRLKEDQAKVHGSRFPSDTNQPPALSEELQAKVRTIGLKTFYSQSSAQTKAELAPVLEELQRTMERGNVFHERRR
jgi:hypothetical protein